MTSGGTLLQFHVQVKDKDYYLLAGVANASQDYAGLMFD